jgi:hypothetical protein
MGGSGWRSISSMAVLGMWQAVFHRGRGHPVPLRLVHQMRGTLWAGTQEEVAARSRACLRDAEAGGKMAESTTSMVQKPHLATPEFCFGSLSKAGELSGEAR